MDSGIKMIGSQPKIASRLFNITGLCVLNPGTRPFGSLSGMPWHYRALSEPYLLAEYHKRDNPDSDQNEHVGYEEYTQDIIAFTLFFVSRYGMHGLEIRSRRSTF